MSWLIRLLGGPRLSITALISALLAGSSAWHFQTMRYSGKLAHAEASLATYQTQIATAQAKLTESQAKELLGSIPSNTGNFGAADKAAKLFTEHEIKPLQARLVVLNQGLAEIVIRFEAAIG